MNTLIAFIDKERGLSFDGKRPTWDKGLMINLVKTYPKLSGSEYTINKLRTTLLNEEQADLIDNLHIIKNPKYTKYYKRVLVELQTETELKDLINKTQNIILYVWDCEYPSTVKFPELDDNTWELISTEVVEGSIHKNVTKYFYRKKV